jgi:hypothetical protein
MRDLGFGEALDSVTDFVKDIQLRNSVQMKTQIRQAPIHHFLPSSCREPRSGAV